MRLSPASISALGRAKQQAATRRHAFCGPEQLLEVLLREADEGPAAKLVGEHLDARPVLPFRPNASDLSRAIRERVLREADAVARDEGGDEVGPEHLLSALLSPRSSLDDGLRQSVLHRIRERRSAPPPVRAEDPAPERQGAEPCTGLLEPLLPAPEDASLIERPALTDRVMMTLLFGNPLLHGPAGSGRRSLVRLLLREIAAGRAPSALAGMHLVRLDPARLVAGTTYRGELEERCGRLLDELREGTRPRVVVVEDLHLLTGPASGSGGADVASMLIPALRRGEIKILACTTQDLLRERLEKQPGLLDCFTPIVVTPPDREEALRLLERLPDSLAERYGVTFTQDAARTAIGICTEHLPQLAQPGSAERLLRAAAGSHAFERAMLDTDPERTRRPYWSIVGETGEAIGRRHLLLALSQLHRIPLEHLERDIEARLETFGAEFDRSIFGQAPVREIVRRTIKVALLGLSDPRRPRGRLFFLGPPGTGKSETAKLVARALMGSDEALLRFDMSEFQERSSISTLLGSDKGLVGSEEGGYLTEPLRENPHRVILFDEIEKAHPSIFHIFLQVLEYGEVHDKRGRLVSFKHAICIFTSNAGSDPADAAAPPDRAELVRRLQRVFPAEFLDRLEEIVSFTRLAPDARRAIARRQLERVRDQLKEVHGASLRWGGAEEVSGAAQELDDPGARGILRWIQAEVKPALVDAILALPREEREGTQLDLVATTESVRVERRAGTVDDGKARS